MRNLSACATVVGFIITMVAASCVENNYVENYEDAWWKILVLFFLGIILAVIGAVGLSYFNFDNEYQKIVNRVLEDDEVYQEVLGQADEEQDLIPLVSPITDFEMVYLQTLKYKKDIKIEKFDRDKCKTCKHEVPYNCRNKIL